VELNKKLFYFNFNQLAVSRGFDAAVLLLFVVRILLGRGSLFVEDLGFAEFALCFFGPQAGDEKIPVVSVIEVEEHLFLRAENGGEWSGADTGIALFGFLSDVCEEGVLLLAAIRILEVVVKAVGMIHIEADGIEDALRKHFKALRRGLDDGG
jgi:hypothetical protein